VVGLVEQLHDGRVRLSLKWNVSGTTFGEAIAPRELTPMCDTPFELDEARRGVLRVIRANGELVLLGRA
jgi:hypothetical protein